MKSLLPLAAAGMLLFAGCDAFDQTPVKVRVMVVWTLDDYVRSPSCGGQVPYPHTIVERLDTGERVFLKGHTWGNTGDVFSIRQCNLRW